MKFEMTMVGICIFSLLSWSFYISGAVGDASSWPAFVCNKSHKSACHTSSATDRYRRTPPSPSSIHAEDSSSSSSSSSSNNEYKSRNTNKYKFGDLTKTLITKITKKDKYEFGDLSKHLDQQAKQKVALMGNKTDYEFGDLTKLVKSRIGDEVKDFTNKDKYEFGSITKEIGRRVASREYTFEDLIMLFKILLAFGAGLSPVANFLPAKLLIQLLDYSIVGDVSNRVIASITTELDRRMKRAVTGDEDYKLGDFTKKSVMKYIGKEDGTYEFGDITKVVLDSLDEKNSKRSGSDQGSILSQVDEELVTKELEEWDKNFLVKYNETTTISSNDGK